MQFDIKSRDTTAHRGYGGEFIGMLPAIDAVRDIRVGPLFSTRLCFGMDLKHYGGAMMLLLLQIPPILAQHSIHSWIKRISVICSGRSATPPARVPFSSMYFVYAIVPRASISRFKRP